MPTYVTLVRFTDQGIRNIKESPARLEAAKKAAQAAGARRSSPSILRWGPTTSS